jgi:hypothetical protein
MVRILPVLLGMLTAGRPRRRDLAGRGRAGWMDILHPDPLAADPGWHGDPAAWPGYPAAQGGDPRGWRGDQGVLGDDPRGWRGDPAALGGDPRGWHGDPSASHGDTRALRGDPAASHGDTRALRADPAASHDDPRALRGDPSALRGDPAAWRGDPGSGRPRIPRWLKWTAAIAVIGLIFRRSVAALTLMALSAALHLVGINVHLPHIRLAWPWQTISAGTTTNADLGPWVLQKIEGISKPALGQANFTFFFTRKVSKSIGIWPCWYSSTFYAVGHASATVDLNPGPAWWTPKAGHYRLEVLSRPGTGKPGHVSVMMVLPLPQLPQSAHDVNIDNIPSRPIDVQHSWTYPGFGCGVLLRPQFSDSVLYAEAQSIAFGKSRRSSLITHELISTAETQAIRTIRDNFIQPTVNAFGYSLTGFTIRWAATP